MGSYKHLEVQASSRVPSEDVSRVYDLCNHALAKAREAHQQVIESTHVLEEKTEWLSWSATRTRSTGCHHSHSCGHLRRWSRGCLRGHTKTPQVGIMLRPHWQFPAKRTKGKIPPISQTYLAKKVGHLPGPERRVFV